MSACISLYELIDKIFEEDDERTYLRFYEKTNKPMKGVKRNKRKYKDLLKLFNYTNTDNSILFRENDGRYVIFETPVIEKMYTQGWWFNKRLFKESNSTHYAFTSKEALILLKRYVPDLNKVKDIYEFVKHEEIAYKYILVLAW